MDFQQFGTDGDNDVRANIVGTKVLVNRLPMEIVGIADAGFNGIDPDDLAAFQATFAAITSGASPCMT